MGTALTTMTADRMKRLLVKEMESLDGGLVFQNVGAGLRIKAFWNISRHRLYEADGYQNMKAFSEATGFSYRWVQKLIEQGDLMASVIFGASTPADEQYLTAEHVKMFVEAKRQANLLAKSDPLQLNAGGDAGIVLAEEGDVKNIAKRLAKNMREKNASRQTSDTEEAPVTQKAQEFIDAFMRKRLLVDNILRCCFVGEQNMLDTYNALSWDDQAPILAAARTKILSMPKLG